VYPRQTAAGQLYVSGRLRYFMRTTLTISLLLCSVVLAGAVYSQTQTVSTRDAVAADYYSAITLLSQGKTTWLPSPKDRDWEQGETVGFAYRIVITTSEIYNTIYFEKITYGAEGSGSKIAWSHQLDMKEFAQRFQILGELSGIQFSKWLSPVSFGFVFQGKQYVVQDVSKRKVVVKQQ